MSHHVAPSAEMLNLSVGVAGKRFVIPTTPHGATAASKLLVRLEPVSAAEAPVPDLVKLLALAERITHLNAAVPSIGAGMLASLIEDAHRALGQQGCKAVAAPQPASTFESLPLASCSLSIAERERWINVLDPLIKYAGRPGDWGRESKLGVLTMRLMQARAEIAATEGRES